MENVYELLYMIRTGDTRAFEMLKEECYPIIASMASQMTGKVACYGITRDDLIQEGLICIDISARSYRPDRNAGFKTFLNVMIDRKFKHILRNCHTDKRTEEESMLSLDQYVNAKGQRIERFYAQKDKLSEPEYYLAFMEALEKLKQTIDELSEEDREALREWFRLTGSGNRLAYGTKKDLNPYRRMYQVKKQVIKRFKKASDPENR